MCTATNKCAGRRYEAFVVVTPHFSYYPGITTLFDKNETEVDLLS